MKFKLTSPRDATPEMARVFLGSNSAIIEVAEDRCFGQEAHWNLGTVKLDADPHYEASILKSLRQGAFEWSVPPYEAALKSLIHLMKIEEPRDDSKKNELDAHERTLARLHRVMDSVATTAVRVGLVLPIFDARSVEDMPFRQGTTVIADTSGVLQGGLDFVSKFLHPAARIKIPAVVHMEVVNQADGFLKRRRAQKTNAPALLHDHILSQASQRALLRLELRADTEVERSLLVGDPLRNAFQRDTNPEWADLQLSVPLRSYCDRLILEAARQHQSHSNPGHRLQLLTCDQGFARMALAEGVTPLYFRAVSGHAFFGHTLTGTRFHPFKPTLHQVGLVEVLWELATAFGSARLVSPDGSRWVEIAAFGEELTWSPVHSHNDLLWMREAGLSAPNVPVAQANETAQSSTPEAAVTNETATPEVKQTEKKPNAVTTAKPANSGFYRFNVERMFKFIVKLADEGRLSDERANMIVDAKAESGFSEFRRFLLSGNLASHDDGHWALTEAGTGLATAIRDADPDRIVDGLSRVPSVGQFFQELTNSHVGHPLHMNLPKRAANTYWTLAEVCLLAARIPDEGYYPTTTHMKLHEFAQSAISRFEELDNGEGIVSVGAWLEALIRKNGVHPERSRRFLDEAQASGFINRSTEGSTTDTRHDQHAVSVLRNGSGGPRIDIVHLYRGDFLIPNKSSSSLRLGAVR